MRTYYAYIRVSTIKQGERGSSLTEQRDAITRYADKHGLAISEWFEELETAAKAGRRVFKSMMLRLKRGSAHGLIIHKVDRSARNLADWAQLAALMDAGIDVHFAHEAIDLQTRGGRLSADIQAVVAADFIRNLRDEVKKGMYGRLKQGIYPFRAPPGYLDTGGGLPKAIDPIHGPLIQAAFAKYATSNYPIAALADMFAAQGLKNKNGAILPTNQMARVLANPFYFGLMRVNGQTYIGKHPPLISKALFDDCRAVAEGRTNTPPPSRISHDRILRRMIRCVYCNRNLTGETQKGHVYYRCHTGSCPKICHREDMILAQLFGDLARLPEIVEFDLALRQMEKVSAPDMEKRLAGELTGCELTLAAIMKRKRMLLDTLLDGLVDQVSYTDRLTALNSDEIAATARLAEIRRGIDQTKEETVKKFELLKSLKNIAHSENMGKNILKPAQIREILKSATSNFTASEKTIAVQWISAVSTLLSSESPYLVRHHD